MCRGLHRPEVLSTHAGPGPKCSVLATWCCRLPFSCVVERASQALCAAPVSSAVEEAWGRLCHGDRDKDQETQIVCGRCHRSGRSWLGTSGGIRPPVAGSKSWRGIWGGGPRLEGTVGH